MATKSFNQSLTQNGGSDGTLAVANSSGFEVGAVVFLAAKDERIRQLKIAAKPTGTSVIVTDMADAVFDASAFTTTKEAKLFQPRSTLVVPSDPGNAPVASTLITKTTSISVANGGTELVLNADSGNALLVKKNGVSKSVINADGKLGIGVLSPTAHIEAAGIIHSTTGGFKFPDGTVQTTAGGGGGGGGGSASAWLTDAGAPSSGLGSDGDFYLNSSNGDYYQKASGSWSLVGSLKGATGAAGATGATGAAGVDGATWLSNSGAPSNSSGANGDFYLNSSNGDYYKKSAGSWSLIANLTGPTGATGPAGATGATGPAGATGATGPAGATGATGPAGATWLNGNGAPSNSSGANGDFYLDNSNKDYYKKVNGSWALQGSLTSGAGASSLQGAYDGGDTIVLTNGNDFQIDAPLSGTAGLLLNAKGVRSNMTVTNERLDLKSIGSRASGLQVLLDCTNSAGSSQVVAQANTVALLQAGDAPGYPFYFQADGGNRMVAMEANDSLGAIYVGGGAANSSINVGTAGQRYITLGNSNGATTMDINAGTGGVLIDSVGTISIDASGASNLTVTGATLTLSTATSGDVEVQAAGGINIGTVSSNNPINIGTAGVRSGVNLGSRTAPVMMGTATPSNQNGAPVGYLLKSAGTSQFAITEIVRFDSSGNLAKASASGSGVAREVIGVALNSDSASSARVATMPGSVVEMKFAAAPSAGDEGKMVYLSTTAGSATLTSPSSAGQRVYRLGILTSSVAGPNGGYFVVYQPQFVQDL